MVFLSRKAPKELRTAFREIRSLDNFDCSRTR